MNKYIKILRPDHWIKQLFIAPGIFFALVLTSVAITNSLYFNILLGFISTSLIASANYAINEYLDAEFDKFHPTKKFRPVVTEGVSGKVVFVLWGGISVLGMCIGYIVGIPFFLTIVWLWVMGILYNVKPIRTKDIPVLDVCSESINNAIRLLLGWFIVTSATMPPCSMLIGYWMGGAFLMAVKRFAEYRMINDPERAGLYRKSFKYYTEKSLLISSFAYAVIAIFFCGIFLIKYRVELILFMPFFLGIFIYYFNMAFDEDSAVQKPEKLFKEKGLMIYCIVLFVVFFVLMVVDIPQLGVFTSNELIRI